MSRPRIEPLAPPYDAEVTRELCKLAAPGTEPLRLFRTLAHNARVLGRFRRAGLLDPGAISAFEREVVILRTCARCESEYEWGVHTWLARQCGLSGDQIEATARHGAEHQAWGPSERLLVRLVDELHESARISDGLWGALAARWDAAQLVELIVLAGFYHMVSLVANALRVELEEAAPRFPEVHP